MYTPTTPSGQQVRFHAVDRPDAIAIADRETRTSYAALDRQIAVLCHAFRAMGLRAGQSAAVCLAHLHHELPVLLACEELGVATMSFHRSETDFVPLAKVDHILCDHAVPEPYADKQRDLSPDAFQALLKTPPADLPPAVPDPGDAARISRTSGTTGTQKLIAVSRKVLALRIGHCRANLSITRNARYLITYPFSVATSYHAACACLWAGGTVIRDARAPLARILAAYKPTLLIFLPRALYGVLENLPADFPKPSFLVVRTMGASLAQPLRNRLLERLATEVVEGYGINETGAICEINAQKKGMVIPGVEVEIVDPTDSPVPHGRQGQVRVRSPLVVDGYLDSPEMTARHFRNGWFHTNDIGIMDGSRVLRLLGRADDIVNIGGIKVMAPLLEDRVLEDARIGDAGIGYLTDTNGAGILCVGVVMKEGATIKDVGPGIERLIEPVCKSFRIVPLPSVPRTEFGKLRRHALAEAIAHASRPAPSAIADRETA